MVELTRAIAPKNLFGPDTVEDLDLAIAWTRLLRRRQTGRKDPDLLMMQAVRQEPTDAYPANKPYAGEEVLGKPRFLCCLTANGHSGYLMGR